MHWLRNPGSCYNDKIPKDSCMQKAEDGSCLRSQSPGEYSAALGPPSPTPTPLHPTHRRPNLGHKRVQLLPFSLQLEGGKTMPKANGSNPKICIHHSCSHPIGQDLITWPHPAAKASLKPGSTHPAKTQLVLLLNRLRGGGTKRNCLQCLSHTNSRLVAQCFDG